jgi:hypothetical protein
MSKTWTPEEKIKMDQEVEGFKAWWKRKILGLSFTHRWINKCVANLSWNASRIELITEQLAEIEKVKNAIDRTPHRLTIKWRSGDSRTIESMDHYVFVGISDWFSGIGEDTTREVMTFTSHHGNCDAIYSLKKSEIASIDLTLIYRDGKSLIKID